MKTPEIVELERQYQMEPDIEKRANLKQKIRELQGGKLKHNCTEEVCENCGS